jgi:L-asparaginase
LAHALSLSSGQANTLDTFRALEQGYIGGFLSTKPLFFYPPAQATFKQNFNISGVDSLPMVDILYGFVRLSHLCHRKRNL